jgi:hypothetical protein
MQPRLTQNAPSDKSNKKAAGDFTTDGPEKTWKKSLLTRGAEHLHRLRGLSSDSAGLHRLLLGHKVLGHSAKLGHGLGLAAAGAESNSAGNGNEKSGEFHKSEYG